MAMFSSGSDTTNPSPHPPASPRQAGKEPGLSIIAVGTHITGEVDTNEEDDRYIMSVFEEFTDMKNQCAEDTSKLTFERFAAKLRRNRQNLIDRFGCRTVKFQVYVKNGKAALKATPIKE